MYKRQISGGVAGAVAGSAVAGKRAERKNTASKENRGNTTSSMGQRAGSKVGAVLDTKNKAVSYTHLDVYKRQQVRSAMVLWRITSEQSEILRNTHWQNGN